MLIDVDVVVVAVDDVVDVVHCVRHEKGTYNNFMVPEKREIF